MVGLLLNSVLIMSVVLPVYMAKRDRSVRRALTKTVIGIALFDLFYVAMLFLVYPRIFKAP